MLLNCWRGSLQSLHSLRIKTSKLQVADLESLDCVMLDPREFELQEAVLWSLECLAPTRLLSIWVVTGLFGREIQYFCGFLLRSNVITPVKSSLLRLGRFFAPFLSHIAAALFCSLNHRSMSSRDLNMEPRLLSLTLRCRRSFKDANFLRNELLIRGLLLAFVSGVLLASNVLSGAVVLSRRNARTVSTTYLKRFPFLPESLSLCEALCFVGGNWVESWFTVNTSPSSCSCTPSSVLVYCVVPPHVTVLFSSCWGFLRVLNDEKAVRTVGAMSSVVSSGTNDCSSAT